MTAQQRNWATNQAFGATAFHQPETIDELRRLVAASSKVKAIGSRHSFNAIADSPGDLVSLEKLDRVLAIDPERRTATVEGGIRYWPLAIALHDAGFALPNTASLPHISVAGACATATHGSGDRNPILAGAVSAMDLVTADGSLVTLSRERDGDLFLGAVVNLGALGVVVTLRLDLIPTFQVQQVVYENLSLEQLADNFDAVMASGYSVSPFTTWRDDRFQVWVKRLVAGGEPQGTSLEAFGATAALVNRHPIDGASPEHWTAQLGVPGHWHERLPHFRSDGIAASGSELQSEYFVPREHARATLLAIAGLRDRLGPLLHAAEIRSIAADDFWMSPFNGRGCIAFHFTWRPDWPAVAALLPQLEEWIDPFDARPHWGKLFATSPARLRELYPRLPDFQALARKLDPAGKFRNAFLDGYIYS